MDGRAVRCVGGVEGEKDWRDERRDGRAVRRVVGVKREGVIGEVEG